MKKLDNEQIYHLIDLLTMDIRHTPYKVLLDDEQKKESIKYDKDLIAILEKMLYEKAV